MTAATLTRRMEAAEQRVAALEARRDAPPLPDILTLARMAGLDPVDEWQAEFLTSTARQVLVLGGRQIGKSTAAGVLAAHTALTKPGQPVVLISRSLRQSTELYRAAAVAYKALGAAAPRVRAESALRVEFENGSRIIALPGASETIRGIANVSLAIADESSFIPDAVLYALKPVLAVSQGRLIGAGTAWARDGWFYRAMTSDDDDWQRFRVPSTECSRITPEFLAGEQRSMPEAWYAAEYECVWRETDDALLARQAVLDALDADAVPLFGGGRLFT